MIADVLQEYGLNGGTSTSPFGTGLINHTWKVENGSKKFILQKINTNIFKDPQKIANNIALVANYINQSAPGYYFAPPVKTNRGEPFSVGSDGGYYRMFPFVDGSHSIDVVVTPAQAFEAAAQFGRFTKTLSGLDTAKLHITLPSFHDLSLRYRQFLDALQNGNPQRIEECAGLIEKLKGFSGIVEEYERIKQDPDFRLRVTHHDTKISNVLFNEQDKAICVIDLDTIMPGYFISDVGDMMRTYLCPVSEEEADTSKIEVRDAFYKAIVDGYGSEMQGELSEKEKQYFFFAGKFMIYMQALRFLTDYLNNDVYYGAKYEKHNLVRAKNQTVLLEKLMEKEGALA